MRHFGRVTGNPRMEGWTDAQADADSHLQINWLPFPDRIRGRLHGAGRTGVGAYANERRPHRAIHADGTGHYGFRNGGRRRDGGE